MALQWEGDGNSTTGGVWCVSSFFFSQITDLKVLQCHEGVMKQLSNFSSYGRRWV